ncbi:unnamed protein product [Arctia plantaginis]|uniref:Uncharacterized protein n=1 Tax=Arctia plantaginis TaxID=874455 RepID=A0A8S0ZM89_ARCPL|nr:unnamed protein product [Arctia plantaginis]
MLDSSQVSSRHPPGDELHPYTNNNILISFDSRETTRAVVKERGARTAATFGRMRVALPLTSHRVADLLSETR